MERVENVLPYVSKGVGVSEGKEGKLRVETDDALDVLGELVDKVEFRGAVGFVTDFTLPLVLGSTEVERVGQSDLIGVWERSSE